MKIKKGDTVVIIAGKDRGKTGKVTKALPQEGRIVVDGLNMRKKHVRSRRQGEQGQVITKPFAFDISNAKLVCPKCGKSARVGYSVSENGKNRICKKCKREL